MRRWRASIGLRLATGLLLLGLIGLGTAGLALLAMDRKIARQAEVTRLADSEKLLERVRVGVYAVVMESRGLYLAANRGQAERFAQGLVRHLGEMREAWAELRPNLPPAEAERIARLEAAFAEFVRLRTELARIGVEQGVRAAGMFPRSAGRQRRVRPGSRVGVGTVLPTTVELASRPDFAELPPGELVMAVGRTGYCGIVRLEDGRLDLAAAIDRRSLTPSPGAGVSLILGEALGLADAATATLAATLAASPWRATPPLTHTTPLVAGTTGRILRVGDAAGYIEPFTGEGIGWALASGRLLAAAVTTSPETAAARLLPPATAAARYVAAHLRHFRPRHARCGRIARGLRMRSVVQAAVRTASLVPWVARHAATAVVGGGFPAGFGR